jgi:hypothetical protein
MHEIRGENHRDGGNDRMNVRKIDRLSSEGVPWGGGVVHSRRAKISQAVHILFTLTASRPASGLRLEIVCQIDKKKSEFYFVPTEKKS